MAKIELNASQQHRIVVALMEKVERQGLSIEFSAKFLPGTAENEWVVTLQLITPKSQLPIGTLCKVQMELQKFDINGSYGRTVLLNIRGSKEAFLELIQQPRPAVPVSPHTPTPTSNPQPNNQRPLASPQKINDYGREDRH